MSTDTAIFGDGPAWLVLAQDEVLGAGGAGAAGGGEAGAVEGADGSGGADGAGAAPSGRPAGGGLDLIFPLLIGLMLFMIITSMLSGRKEKKRRAEMLASLSRGAKVQTIGGVIGTVAEVRDSEVVVTVDRATQTRMTFARSSVQQILSEGRGSDHSESEVAEPELEKVG